MPLYTLTAVDRFDHELECSNQGEADTVAEAMEKLLPGVLQSVKFHEGLYFFEIRSDAQVMSAAHKTWRWKMEFHEPGNEMVTSLHTLRQLARLCHYTLPEEVKLDVNPTH